MIHAVKRELRVLGTSLCLLSAALLAALVLLALAAGDRREVEQHADAVLARPLERLVNVLGAREKIARVAFGLEGMPRHRKPHGVEPQDLHALEIVLRNERIVVLPDPLVVRLGAERLDELVFVRRPRGREQRGRNPRLGDEPARKVHAAQTRC